MNDSVNKSNENIKNLYKEFFNAGQVGLLNKFEFSKEKIVSAKGCLLFTESERNSRLNFRVWYPKSRI